MITNSKPYILTIVILITIFGIYNYLGYNADGFIPVEKLSSEAVKGLQLFQRNNGALYNEDFNILIEQYENIDRKID